MLKSTTFLCFFAAGLALSGCATMDGQAPTQVDRAPMPQSNPMPPSAPAMPSSSGY